MNLTCPNCGMENAYFDIIDGKGSHYICPDCDNEWTDSSDKLEDVEEDDEDEIEEDEK